MNYVFFEGAESIGCGKLLMTLNAYEMRLKRRIFNFMDKPRAHSKTKVY